jgi:hypothetical protein
MNLEGFREFLHGHTTHGQFFTTHGDSFYTDGVVQRVKQIGYCSKEIQTMWSSRLSRTLRLNIVVQV